MSRATGFLGKNTDASAIRSLGLAAKQTETGSTYSSGPDTNGNKPQLPGVKDIMGETPTASVGYSLNDFPITTPAQINPQEKPPFHLAHFFVRQYFPTIQRYFPLVDELSFLRKFWSAYDVASDPVPLEAKWPIMMNLVFAISAKYCEATQGHSDLYSGRHLDYFTRARIQGLSESSLFDHADLQQTQIEGLVAFYFLITGQTNRAWKMSGISVRSALSLGLNIRAAGPTVSAVSSEVRIRIWWSLWTLDQTLNLMTGRNSEVDLALCNVPLPHPFTEAGFDGGYQYQKPANDLESVSIGKRMSSYAASSFAQRDNTPRLDRDKTDMALTEPEIQLVNDSHLYFHYLQLFLMSRDVTKNLYTIDCSRKQWPDIEASISTLWDSTVLWLRQLPDEYNFGRPDVSLGSAAMSLGCFFYSVRIMITRPCLCRHDRRRMASSKVALFHRNTAEACVKSAKAMIELFLDEFNVHRLCEASTWWQFTHYLVQAITILLIELRFWEKP